MHLYFKERNDWKIYLGHEKHSIPQENMIDDNAEK